jgi:outer membrane protein OmpA-like peptidoglycan-associated protein
MKILLLLLALFSFSVFIYPQSYGVNYHAFSTTLVLTLEGAATLEHTDYNGNRFDYMGKATIEYFLPSFSRSSFGIRGFSGIGFISGKQSIMTPDFFRTELRILGGGVIYMLSLSKSVYPYFFGGASYIWFNPLGSSGEKLTNSAAGRYKKHEINFNGELGIRFLIADDLSFNLSGAVHVSPNDNLDDITGGTSNDAFFAFGAGFSFSFFTEKDSDNDGILDSKDLCSKTPSGVIVDDFGCPVDTDKDGVPDNSDQCLDTPLRVAVDKNGCPLDSDMDGVYDYIDICPNTIRGISVDKIGCPVDTDSDGVPDYKDECKATPINTAVDENGCPLDSDLDGVPDNEDQCPGTTPGAHVDEFGCEKVELKELILSSGANFAFNSSELLPAAYQQLDILVNVMKEDPSSRWRIEGHTDNLGSAQINRKISLERANAVLNYFVSKGINRNRFDVVGLGMDFPVADNSTEDGRAKNRRVAILRID